MSLNTCTSAMKRLLLGIMMAGCIYSQSHAAQTSPPLSDATPKTRITSTIDDNSRIALIGNRHPSAQPENDLGPVDDTLRLDRMILSLKSDERQTAALDAFLETARDPSSPQFGRWLTARDFERHFGVSQQDIDTISRWLIRHGFTIDEIPAGRRAIVFSGTAAQIREAFHTQIHHYQFHGELHLANADEPQIPKALAAVVQGVVSLHDFRSQPQHIRQDTLPNYTTGSTHYMAAGDFSTIYGLKTLYGQSINGNGRSIAVLGRSNVVLADIQQFRTVMNLPANPPQVIVNGADPGLVSGDQAESDLDLEWSGGVAPAATIKFVTSKSTATTDGIDLSAQYAVSNNAADVISLSYGLCEASLGSAGASFYNNLWQQAVAQGISVAVSSGDSGAAGCDSSTATRATHGQGVNGLCTSPYSTCVGGTTFADTTNPSLYWATSNNSDLSSALSYIPEAAWNESGANGGTGLWSSGGGASSIYAKPSWQNTPGVPADGKRDVPDVALSAATHDGYLVYSSDNSTATQTLYVFGGTSAAAPSFAGILALLDQKVGYRQGNANPTLYGLASRQASGGSAYFHTITSGNNSVPGVTGFSASSATPYFNQVTGLGSMDGGLLASHWTDLLPATSTAVTSSANPSGTGQNISFTATVTGSTPTGNVQFADNGVNLGAPVALTNAQATLATAALTAGSHSITAAYSGDIHNQASLSPTLTQMVLTTTGTTLSSSSQSITGGMSVTFTANVTGASPTGTVKFMDGTVSLGTSVLTAGKATLTTSGLGVGSHSISAVYSGDANNLGSSSTTLTETVNPSANGSTDSDVPTLPEWAAFLLGSGLLWSIRKFRCGRPDHPIGT